MNRRLQMVMSPSGDALLEAFVVSCAAHFVDELAVTSITEVQRLVLWERRRAVLAAGR